ncbi:TPA: PDZ domain-containing protein [Candidatus Poribacteria bacterium]|nr:PDZ domain-containing protein [Candidatus Poribacteria bacterium]
MRQNLLSIIVIALIGWIAWESALSQTPSDVIERCSPAVVKIEAKGKIKEGKLPDYLKEPFEEFFKREPGEIFRFRIPSPKPYGETMISLSSGFLIDGEGHIVTSCILIGKRKDINVTLSNGREIKAEVVGSDDVSGVAVLKVNPDELGGIEPLQFAEAESLKPGQSVIALGYLMNMGLSASTGIISGLDRSAGKFSGLIQTDALIRQGMAGGPLLNMEGKVVGMNIAVEERSKDLGFGFAVPADTVRRVFESLIRSGRVRRGYLGVYISSIDADLAKKLKLKSREGVLITEVISGSPAERAGFKNGDVVLEVDGVKVKGPAQFQRLILNTEPGTELNMKVIRDGKEIELKVEIGERSGGGKSPGLFTWRGISLQEMTEELAKRFGYEGEEGVLVSNVKPGSPGYEAGIQPGDLITEVERKPVKSIDQFREKVKDLKGDVLLHLRRGKGALFVVVKPEEKG